MKVKHKVTGEIHEVLTDMVGSREIKKGFILARTNLDLMKQTDRERYDRIIKLGIQCTVYCIQEPATDFEEVGK